MHWQSCLVNNLSAILRTHVDVMERLYSQTLSSDIHTGILTSKIKIKKMLVNQYLNGIILLSASMVERERQLLEHPWEALNYSF